MGNDINGNAESGLTKVDGNAAAISPKHSKFSIILNKYFHHIDRGGTLKGEIMAGITVFFIAICVLFMNMQAIAAAQGVTGAIEGTNAAGWNTNVANGQMIAGLYISSVLIAFIGSLLIGLIARLPFVQMSMMGLSSSMICYLGTASGLTYYNLLFISLIAAIIYAVIVSVPVIKEAVFKAIPVPIRKILPAATGLIVAYMALQLSGFFSTVEVAVGGSSINMNVIAGSSLFDDPASADGTQLFTIAAFAAGIVAIAVYFILKRLRLKHPVFWSFLSGTLLFIVILLFASGFDINSATSFGNYGRLWVMTASQSSQTTPLGDSYLTYFGDAFGSVFSSFGRVFSEGTQFADGTNVFTVMVTGVLCYLFMGMYDAQSTLQATQRKLNINANETSAVNFDSIKGSQLALMCNAGMNVIAPFLGVGGVTISKTSVAGTEDNGKSGLVSVVASIGFLISLFVWAFPCIFATSTFPTEVSSYNYSGYGYGAFIELTMALSFGIANAVMVCVGLSMCKCFKDIDWSEYTEWMPAIITVIASVAFTNLAYGVGFGVISYCVLKALSFRKNEGDKFFASLKNNFMTGIREIGIPTGVLAVLMLIMLLTV